MSYSIIDPILKSWADSHGLHIYTQYKDVEVRSINIVSPKGKRFQLWVDEPSQAGNTSIHIWDMKKQSQNYLTTKSCLTNELESAYQQIKSWF